MNFKIITIVFVLAIGLFVDTAIAQISSGGFGKSPFTRDFGDVKLLDAYFGTEETKIEAEPGDNNLPFTIVFANVGTQDITGIKGQLSLPYGFSSAQGNNQLVIADSDSNSFAGENFFLTFFVNIDKNTKIQQFPGSVKVDYSRLRESGVRNSFFDFNFKVTGDSIINIKALDPFLISLTTNKVIIEISNDGTGPISAVDIELKNTDNEMSSNTQSTTNVNKVVILNTNWDIKELGPGEKKIIETEVYIPASLKDATLRAPLEITFFDGNGDQQVITKMVDFYVKGFIDVSISEVNVIDLSNQLTVIGEIVNEGNEDALFGYVTIDPMGDSNIKSSTQFIDDIEVDSPVPFNIPLVFEREQKPGQHDIKITVRYKDSTRNENFESKDTQIIVPEIIKEEQNDLTFVPIVVIALAGIIGFILFKKYRKKE